MLKSSGIRADQIINIDETPIFIDMLGARTISFKGEKNTEFVSNGHQKTRLTVVIAIYASGKFLKTLLILKGLKNEPKCTIPAIYMSPLLNQVLWIRI